MKANRFSDILFILPLAFFFPLFTMGQPMQASVKSSQEDSIQKQILAIKAEYAKINAAVPKLKLVNKDVPGESAEGGEAKKYYDGKIIRKAILIFYGETGQSREEFYFSNHELIFLYTIEEHYKMPLGTGKTIVQSKEENRFYFNNGRLIRWLNPKGKIEDTHLYPEKQKEMLEDLKYIK